MKRLIPFFVLSSVLGACRGDIRSNPLMDLMQTTPRLAPAPRALVAFRLPAAGGEARLYRLPSFDEESWRFDWGPYETVRALGFGKADAQVYALTAAQELVALDLDAGRTRLLDSNVAVAVVDPTDRPVVVHQDLTVSTVDGRTVVRWPDTLPALPTHLWGAARGRIVAVVEQEGTRELIMLQSGEAPVRQPLPDGPVAASYWGDVVAVASDSGVSTFDPAAAGAAAFVPVAGPRLIAFSPSGHHIYTVVGNDLLVTYDRFDLVEVARKRLPGRASALRVDPRGERLLVGREGVDSLWIVRAGRGRRTWTVGGSWDADLPAVATDGSIVIRRGRQVVALAGAGLRDTTFIGAPERDQWLLTTWEPRQPTHQLAVTSDDARPAGRVFYVQVSSSRNPAWAEDFAQKLRAAGMEALVLQPDDIDELYHVVLGPYTSRAEADAVGRRMGLPFWIVTRESEVPRR